MFVERMPARFVRILEGEVRAINYCISVELIYRIYLIFRITLFRGRFQRSSFSCNNICDVTRL
jgi:hypothetical protein